MEDMIYTVAEVAKLLKTNPSYVHELRKSKRLRFMKLGSYKCRSETLEEFLKESEGKDLTDPFNVKELEENKIE